MKMNRPFLIKRWRQVRTVLICASAISLGVHENAAGQAVDQNFFAYPGKDKAFVFVSGEALAKAAGFNVYRADAPDLSNIDGEPESVQAELKAKADRFSKSGPADKDFVLLTPSPVAPIKKSQDILAAFGEAGVDAVAELDLATPDELWADYAKRPEKYEFLAWFFMPISKVLGRVYEDNAVASGGIYYYRISIVSSNGKELKKFGPTRLQVVPPTIAPMSGFSIKAGDGGAEVFWKAPETADNAVGLNIYRGASQDGPFDKVNKGVISMSSDPHYLDSTLENGKSYFYYLVAVDFVGNESAKTEILQVEPKDMTPPAPPQNVKVELNDKIAAVSWSMSLEPDMNGYFIQRSENMSDGFANITDSLLDSDVTNFDDAGIEGGRPYYYRLIAVDKNDNSSAPSVAAELRVPDMVPPKAPLGLKAAPSGKNSISISWDKSPESDLIGYNVYRGSAPDKLERANMEFVPKDKPQYVDNGIVSGETYFYSISAVDVSMNESVLIDPPFKVVAPDSIPPQFPMGVFALAEDGRVSVSWARRMESDVAGFKLFRSFDENGKYEQIGEKISKDQTSYVDEPVVNGKKLWYYLTAFDESGNESEPSGKVMALPFDQVPPAEPSAPAGTPGDKKVELSWSAGPETDLKGYFVWRATVSASGEYQLISGEAPLPVNKLSFTDAGLKTGIDYWYRISAIDTSENESRKSDAAGPFKFEEPKPEETAAPPAETKGKK